MQELIVGTLETLGKEFRKNELAYLALTSKIEIPLRDRWAFSLFRDLYMDYNVSREWKRTDLAILNGQVPCSLIELKAMYTFDAALDKNGIGGFTDAMSSDAKKAKILAKEHTDIYIQSYLLHILVHSSIRK